MPSKCHSLKKNFIMIKGIVHPVMSNETSAVIYSTSSCMSFFPRHEVEEMTECSLFGEV